MGVMADFCHWCDKELVRGAGNMEYRESRFCCTKCRTAYHNAVKKVERQKKAAIKAFEDIQGLLTKQGDLGHDALETMRYLIAKAQLVELDPYCRNCGQKTFMIPQYGQKCSFCQDENWGFKDKVKNPPKE